MGITDISSGKEKNKKEVMDGLKELIAKFESGELTGFFGMIINKNGDFATHAFSTKLITTTQMVGMMEFLKLDIIMSSKCEDK